MKNTKLSKRYAKALFEFALEKGEIETVKNDMDMICNVVKQSKDFNFFIDSPVISNKKKNKTFSILFENKINIISLKFFSIIFSKNREKYIPLISLSYIEIYKEFKNIKDVYVETPVGLDNETKNKLIARLKSQLNAEIHLQESINKDLIGGMVLVVDDKQIDNSYRTMLNKLRREMSINEYEISF